MAKLSCRGRTFGEDEIWNRYYQVNKQEICDFLGLGGRELGVQKFQQVKSVKVLTTRLVGEAESSGD